MAAVRLRRPVRAQRNGDSKRFSWRVLHGDLPMAKFLLREGRHELFNMRGDVGDIDAPVLVVIRALQRIQQSPGKDAVPS